MSIIDISVTLYKGMPVWPESIGIRHKWVKRIGKGDMSNDSTIECDVHAGTHVEAPLHYIEVGESVDLLPLDILCGPVFVADLTSVDSIGERDLSELSLPDSTEKILFKTKNSGLWSKEGFNPDYVALTEDAAAWIVKNGIMLAGIDYLSIQRYHGAPNVHRILLEAGTVILEGLNLSDAIPGQYELLCLPLKLMGAEGAPARAVLVPSMEVMSDGR